jgi:hypothetical protein
MSVDYARIMALLKKGTCHLRPNQVLDVDAYSRTNWPTQRFLLTVSF